MCPRPGYTEEARKAKLQGKLLLEVLVDADGRAARIRLLQGLGLGLDQSAVDTVRGWRFSPARDAHQRAVPMWVTIETRFELFEPQTPEQAQPPFPYRLVELDNLLSIRTGI